VGRDKSKKSKPASPSVKSLSREQKLLFLKGMEEKSRRERQKVDRYEPNSGQLPVHLSEAQIRICTAGNGGGKTTLGVQEILASIYGYNPWHKKNTPVPTRNIVVLDNPDKVEKLWLPALSEWSNLDPKWLKKLGRHHVMQIVYPNGADLSFYFHQQDALIFESIEMDGLVVFDEPPPRHCWVGLRRGGRVKGRQTRYLFVGTPISRAWIRKELIEPAQKGEIDNVDVFKFGTEANRKNLSPGFIEDFSSILSPKERRIRLHGDYFDLSGLALAHLFDRTVHIVPPFDIDPKWPCVIAVDPHPSKAHHAIMMTCDAGGQLYVIDEMAHNLVAKEFAIKLKEFMGKRYVVDIVCDSLGSSDMTGGEGFYSFIQVLQREGIRIRATTYEDKSDEAFIDRIQSQLAIPAAIDNFGMQLPKLRIFEHCQGVVSDIENVQWTKVKGIDENKPKLDITHRDYLACLKYALSTHLVPNKGKVKAVVYNDPAQAYGMKRTGPWKDKEGNYRINAPSRRKRQSLRQWMKDEDEDW